MNDKTELERKEVGQPDKANHDWFVASLVKAGWLTHEAEQEWLDIQNDEESGL